MGGGGEGGLEPTVRRQLAQRAAPVRVLQLPAGPSKRVGSATRVGFQKDSPPPKVPRVVLCLFSFFDVRLMSISDEHTFLQLPQEAR